MKVTLVPVTTVGHHTVMFPDLDIAPHVGKRYGWIFAGAGLALIVFAFRSRKDRHER